MKDENEGIIVNAYGNSILLGKTLGSDGIIHILSMINEQPMRYSDIKKSVNIPKSTLVRHLNTLYDFDILIKQPFFFNGRKTHVYGLTNLGKDVFKFFIRFERITSVKTIQQQLLDTN